ncbi:MAG: glycosyltransferase [Chloroflexota bacterium]
MNRYPGRLAVQQRVLTPYRGAFFDTLAQSCDGGLSVCAGLPRPEESIATTDKMQVARYTLARNIHILRGPLYLCYQRGLQAWLAGWNPDALIVEANPRYLSTSAAVRWMKRRGRPVIGWGLGVPAAPLTPPLSKTGEAGRGWRGAFLRQFDALITYSHRGAGEYAALGFPAEKIFVAPNAATPPPVHPMPIRPEKFREHPNILFVGRLQARKRIDILLQACAALPEAIQPKLIIVGDGPERPALEALAKGIYPSTEFVGAKHGSDLTPYFLAADLFVLPGTGGLAVQEAMTWGLPIVMGQGDGTNDDLVRPENGWQLSGDALSRRIEPVEILTKGPKTLADALREALSDVSRLRRMGAASYRIVSEEINLEKMVEVFVQALGSFKAGV